MANVTYEPSYTLNQFHRDDSFYRAIVGPYGSGKSVGMVMEIIRRASLQAPDADGVRRTRWAVVRNTYEQLKDTTIKTFMDWAPDGTYGRWMSTTKTFHMGMSPITGKSGMKTHFKLPDGTRVHAEVMFRALDRPDQIRNLLSLELTGAWLNEFREIPVEVHRVLSGRVGRFPGGKKTTWSGIFSDSNPYDDDSAYANIYEGDGAKKEIEDIIAELGPEADEMDMSQLEFKLFRQPSGLSPEAENIDNLPGGRMYYIKMLAAAKAEGKDDNWINIHVHGRNGFQMDGKAVYAGRWNDAVHVTNRPLTPNRSLTMGIGLDFGLTPAAIFGQLWPNTQWCIYDELLRSDCGIVEFSKVLREHCQHHFPGMRFIIYGDPAGQQRSQVDARSAFDVLRTDGWTVIASEQSPVMRIESVRAALNRMVGGDPGFVLAEKCSTLRRGFSGGYQYRRVRVPGEARYESKPNKNSYSHPHDALEYLLAPFEIPALKTGRWRTFPAGGSDMSRQRETAVKIKEWSVYDC